VLEDGEGAPLVHLECGSPEKLDALLRCLSVLVAYARARAGADLAATADHAAPSPPPAGQATRGP
jgi:hypothetical protein